VVATRELLTGRSGRLAPLFAGLALLVFGAGFAPAILVAQDPAARPDPAAGDEVPRFPDVPFVVTPMSVVDAMLDVVAPTPTDSLFDLGSGDGRIPVLAAARYGTPSVGVELQDTLVTIARGNARRAGVGELVRFVQGDLFEADLRPATVVTLYLFTTVNLRLRPKLLRELRPGARVVSHHFGMGDWEPDSTIAVAGHNDPVHFWVIPANVTGRWRIRMEGFEPRVMEIEQAYQEIEVRWSGREVAGRIDDAHLRGNSIRLVLRDLADAGPAGIRLEGTVSGDRMDGSTSDGVSWTARRLGGMRPLESGGDAPPGNQGSHAGAGAGDGP